MALIKGKIIRARIKNPTILDQHQYDDDGLDSASLELTQREAHNIIDNARIEAERQAAEIINQAQVKSAELMSTARAQMQAVADEKAKLDLLRENTRLEAYNSGIAEVEEIKDEFLKILSSFQTAKSQILKEAEEEIGSIAVNVAQKLLLSEIKREKGTKALLTRQIRAAIAKVVSGKGMIKISLAVADMQHAKSLKLALSKVLDQEISIHFEAIEAIEPGSCIIETKGGRFDASFSTQIKVINVALEKYLGHKIFDLDQRYPADLETEEMIVSSPSKSNTINVEPSDDDLDALLTDIQNQAYFDEDAELKSKVDDEIFEDDLDLDGDETEDEDLDEDEDEDLLVEEDDLGAVDDDVDLAEVVEEEETADAFIDDDGDSSGDERFPEY